jgi:hypothetical protein
MQVPGFNPATIGCACSSFSGQSLDRPTFLLLRLLPRSANAWDFFCPAPPYTGLHPSIHQTTLFALPHPLTESSSNPTPSRLRPAIPS